MLKPGFSTTSGAVFTSTIAGCLSTTNTSFTSIESEPVKLDSKTENYLQDMREKPVIEDFIQYGNNSSLREIWAKFQEGIEPLLDKERQLNFELKALERQYSTVQNSGNQQILYNYYITKSSKEHAYEITKEEVSQYSYFISPVRTEQGKKLGYDLTIYAGEKIYQSSIR